MSNVVSFFRVRVGVRRLCIFRLTSDVLHANRINAGVLLIVNRQDESPR